MSIGKSSPDRFTDAYKEDVFLIWYNRGKPGPARLRSLIDPDVDNRLPSNFTLSEWIKDFKKQAEEIDVKVKSELEGRTIQAKIEMLERHARIGYRMQEIALQYLEEHKDELRVPNAIKLLIEGVRIEHENRGIPDALKRMTEKSDEELLREVERIMSSTSELRAIGDGEYASDDE